MKRRRHNSQTLRARLRVARSREALAAVQRYAYGAPSRRDERMVVAEIAGTERGLAAAAEHYDAQLAQAQREGVCRRPGCKLPVYSDGLCEPCWEIGRDEV